MAAETKAIPRGSHVKPATAQFPEGEDLGFLILKDLESLEDWQTLVIVGDTVQLSMQRTASTVPIFRVAVAGLTREEDGEVGAVPGPDPWKHRSKGMRCSSCMFYVEKAVQESFPENADGAVAEGAVVVGRCRRHAPSMNGYPVVFPTDWCGDHKLDETKL